MPLTITTLREQEEMEKITEGGINTYYIADRRLYLTTDKKEVVEEGDRRGAFLWATPGTKISEKAAKEFGLVKPKSKPKEKAAPKSRNKAKSKAPNKAVSTAKKK